MKIVSSLDDLFMERKELSGNLGLVPTMGYLHEGHLSLARQAKKDCCTVAATIYVNPTQFGPNEDFSAYPRNLERDLSLLEETGVDLVWTPSEDQMYGAEHQTWVNVEKITQTLEGAMRPGHFRGVTTIVAMLFNAVRPDRAYFGQKDAQQAAVIRRMIQDLNYPIEMVVCPTMREPDGLAMSSRNAYLGVEERRSAAVLYRSLNAADTAYQSGERDGDRLREILLETLLSEPFAKPQYVSCADLETLQELQHVNHGALISMAVYIGKTRLIDNMILKSETE